MSGFPPLEYWPLDVVDEIMKHADLSTLINFSMTCKFNYIKSKESIETRITELMGKTQGLVSCFETHSIFVDINGKVYVCGSNRYGQLGLGDNNNRYIPTSLNLNFKVSQVICGNNHTILIDENKIVYVCGDNQFGQLGLDRNVLKPLNLKFIIKQIDCGPYHTTFLDIYGNIYFNYNLQYPRKFEFKVSQVCNDYYSVLLDVNGKVYIYDYILNKLINLSTNKITQIACKYCYIAILDEHNQIYIYKYDGRCAKINMQINIKFKIAQIACEKNSVIILSDQGIVYECRYNNNNTSNIVEPKRLYLGIKVVRVICGRGHTFLISIFGRIYAYGDNRDGQLGIGDHKNRNNPTLLKFSLFK